jgi:hypothetical protein
MGEKNGNFEMKKLQKHETRKYRITVVEEEGKERIKENLNSSAMKIYRKRKEKGI